VNPIPKATPIVTTPSKQLPNHLPQPFFSRPAEQVAPELIGCLLVKLQKGGAAAECCAFLKISLRIFYIDYFYISKN